MSKPKILVDLAFAHQKMGFSGIPQDSRLLFDGLITSEQFSTTGLLWSNAGSWHGKPPTTLEQQSVFLSVHLTSPQPHLLSRLVGRANKQAGQIAERVLLGRYEKKHIVPLANDFLKEMVYRQFFSSTVDPEHQNAIVHADFALSSLGWWAANDSAVFNLAFPRLDTSGYDFLLFQDSRCIRVSPNTVKVIRYHDGLPVLASDTIMSAHYTKLHCRSIARCASDSIYVCNSPSALNDLGQISEEAARKAVVIPYFVPKMKNSDLGKTKLWELAATRVSPSTLGKQEPDGAARKWFGLSLRSGKKSEKNNAVGETASVETPLFIMSLATIEPRKNYQGLIRSWQKLRAATGRDVKLVIVGRPGWEFEPILREIRPYVASGTLLHLEGLPQNELQIWYKAATCFAFLSFAEGFGLPPIEAMQCGCPVLVSDIPAHRYSAGDGALFCNPYNEDDIVAKLDQLTDPERRNENAALIERGYRNAERFTVANVLPQWEEFFTSHARP